MAAPKFESAPSDALMSQAMDMREEAERTRRLALTLSLHRDRETFLSYAQELEQQAEALERQAAQTRN
jgi:hypothetical protein